MEKALSSQLQLIQLAVMDVEIGLKQFGNKNNWRKVVLDCQKLIHQFVQLAGEFIDAAPLAILGKLFNCVAIVFSRTLDKPEQCHEGADRLSLARVSELSQGNSYRSSTRESALEGRLPVVPHRMGGSRIQPSRGLEEHHKEPRTHQQSLKHENEYKEQYDKLMIEVEMDYASAVVRPQMILANNLWNELGKYEEYIGRCQQSAARLMDSKFSSMSTACNLDDFFSNIESQLQHKKQVSISTTNKLNDLVKAFREIVEGMRVVAKTRETSEKGVQISHFSNEFEMRDMEMKIKSTRAQCHFQEQRCAKLEKKCEGIQKELDASFAFRKKLEETVRTLQQQNSRSEELCRSFYINMMTLESEAMRLNSRLENIRAVSIKDEVESIAGDFSLDMRIRLANIVQGILKKMGFDCNHPEKWVESLRRRSQQITNGIQIRQLDTEAIERYYQDGCERGEDNAGEKDVLKIRISSVAPFERANLLSVGEFPWKLENRVSVRPQSKQSSLTESQTEIVLRPQPEKPNDPVKGPAIAKKKTLIKSSAIKPTYKRPAKKASFVDKRPTNSEEVQNFEPIQEESNQRNQSNPNKPRAGSKASLSRSLKSPANPVSPKLPVVPIKSVKSIMKMPSHKKIENTSALIERQTNRSVKYNQAQDELFHEARSVTEMSARSKVSCLRVTQEFGTQTSSRDEQNMTKSQLSGTRPINRSGSKKETVANCSQIPKQSDLQQRSAHLEINERSAQESPRNEVTFWNQRKLSVQSQSIKGKSLTQFNSVIATPKEQQTSPERKINPFVCYLPPTINHRERLQNHSQDGLLKNRSEDKRQSSSTLQGPLPIDLLKRLEPSKWGKQLISDKEVSRGLMKIMRSDLHSFVRNPTNLQGLLRQAERIHLRSCGSNRCKHLLEFYSLLGSKVMMRRWEKREGTISQTPPINMSQTTKTSPVVPC